MLDNVSPSDNQMSCENVRDELHALICNELDEAEAIPVLEHLKGCQSCRQAMGEHAKLAGIMTEHLPSITRTVFKAYFNRYN